MSQEIETTKKDEVVKKDDVAVAAEPAKTAPTVPAAAAPTANRRPPQRRSSKGRPQRREREPRDFEQKIISIRRVTRVVAGGRRFSFSVAMVIGDGKGSVGVGMGKAGDTALSIQKAINDAKKNMVKINLTDERSIPYQVEAKYKAAQVSIMPNHGRGVVAGSAVRSIFELGGLKDMTAKIQTRSKNKVNIARATIEALRPFVTATGKAAVQASLNKSKPAPVDPKTTDNKEAKKDSK